ncbi:carboxypeptidase-like regulatory domain-containing protein [Noviherbaspirillum sp. ST9]|uniref:carboxypeptidase-like regulatory domain-containing protein n=1 Tax=Noviherbaspirillum sp. ST9 TaxID=3401606 RepID=UPI003B589C19
MKNSVWAALAAASTAFILASCGGGGSDTTTAASGSGTSTGTGTQASSTTISGSAVKGPVANATVTIKNAATGAVLATTTTNAVGAYTLNVPFTGDVIVEISGGTYTDEATGATTNLSSPMKVVVNANGSNVTGMVTPLTTMAYSSAFGGGAAVTSNAFNTSAAKIASQFKLTNVNIVTTLPTVTGTTDAYGQVLRGVSKYMQTQGKTLDTVTNTTFTADQLAAFSSAFNSAYASINPGSAVSFSFDSSGFNVTGTGAGGGTGTCGVNVQGTVTAQGFTVPLNINYCITGIAAGSCGTGNASVSQALAGQSGLAGAANLNYTYASTCAAGAFTVNLQ